MRVGICTQQSPTAARFTGFPVPFQLASTYSATASENQKGSSSVSTAVNPPVSAGAEAVSAVPLSCFFPQK